jgi:hypothetical protein
MSNARRNGLAPHSAIVLGVAALMLAGCASTFDVLPEKLGGLPASAPARPTESAPYPNVYEPMVPREVKPLSSDEQKTLELELLALRESQSQRANPPQPEPVKRKPAEKKQPAKKQAEKKAAEKKATDKPPN